MEKKYINDLLDVGKSKSLGYLSLNTLINICSESIESMMHYAKENKLKYLLLNEYECNIFSGALYLYDEKMLSELLNEYSETLKDAGVPVNDEIEYIRFISEEIVYDNLHPEAYMAIGKTFDDPRFR